MALGIGSAGVPDHVLRELTQPIHHACKGGLHVRFVVFSGDGDGEAFGDFGEDDRSLGGLAYAIDNGETGRNVITFNRPR